MIRTTINLPTRHKLQISLVKRRKSRDEKPLLPNLGEVRRARNGSKISRFFTHIFAHKNIKRILGANMAFAIMATTLVPSATSGFEAEETLISAETVLVTAHSEIRYPVNTVSVTQGYRIFHPGLDLDGLTGDPIYPIMGGTVEGVSYSRYAYGNAVLVGHGNGITSLYAHLSKINVQTGQAIGTKDTIGFMGATGRSYGDHLHLEVRDHGQPINPLLILSR